MRKLTINEKEELNELIDYTRDHIFEKMGLEDEHHEVAILEYVVKELQKDLTK